MTIEKAPSLPVPDPKTVSVYTFHDDEASRFVEEEQYRELVKKAQGRNLNLGIRMLKGSGAVDLLGQLVNALKQDYPDVGYGNRNEFGIEIERIEREEDISFNSEEGGMLIETMVLWDLEKDGSLPNDTSWKSVTVGMRVLTGEIVVTGQELRVIPQSVWSGEGGNQILEDSICNAAVAPIRRSLYNVQIG